VSRPFVGNAVTGIQQQEAFTSYVGCAIGDLDDLVVDIHDAVVAGVAST
jgi:hypothetical protein